jgi:hypothetical protein
VYGSSTAEFTQFLEASFLSFLSACLNVKTEVAGHDVFLLFVFRSLSTASSSAQPQNMMHVAEEAAYAMAFIPATVHFPCNLLCCSSW